VSDVAKGHLADMQPLIARAVRAEERAQRLRAALDEIADDWCGRRMMSDGNYSVFPGVRQEIARAALAAEDER